MGLRIGLSTNATGHTHVRTTIFVGNRLSTLHLSAPWGSTAVFCCVVEVLSFSENIAGTEMERCVFGVLEGEEGKSANVLEGEVAGAGEVVEREEGEVGVLRSACGDSRDPLRSMVSIMYSLLS